MMDDQYKIKPRSEIEKLVTKFIVDNKINAQYGKDTEGLFIVQFLVEEETSQMNRFIINYSPDLIASFK